MANDQLREEARRALLSTIDGLAGALYEGQGLFNLAETLARIHGKADALSFYQMMSEDERNFWRGIAKQLIEHASEWEPNEGSGCVISRREEKRLADLPRVNSGKEGK